MTVKLEIDGAQIGSELSAWMGGIEELTKSSVLTQLVRPVFTITGKRFVIDVDNYSRMNPKKMHHVYEWGKIGQSDGRLFVIERGQILSGNLVINTKFLPSKMPVPINPELLQPGKTGKSVSKQSIFANKAEVMESGRSVSFSAQKVLAFMGSNGIVFIKPGTQVNILHPGGIQTNNSFGSYMLEWYTSNANAVMDSSGFYDQMAIDVAAAMESSNGRASISAVRSAMSKLADRVDAGEMIV